MPSRRAIPQFSFRGIAGAPLARWLSIVLLLPLLILGMLSGGTVLAHSHDGHGLHIHVADTSAGAIQAGAGHRAGHSQGLCDIDRAAHSHREGCSHHRAVRASCQHTAHSGPKPAPSQAPGDDILIALPDVDLLPVVKADLGLASSQVITFDLAGAWHTLDLAIAIEDSPRGAGWNECSVLGAPTARDRLVRTSRALRL